VGASGSAGAGGAAAVCPPQAPYGKNVGDITSDLTLYDCDGKPVQLHSLCAKKAAAVFTFAIWCPVCKAHMDNGEPQALYAKHQTDDFDMFVVVTQTATGATASEAHCKNVRDSYGLKMPVLVDTDDALSTKLGLAVNGGALALSRGARIELKQSYGFDALATTIPTLLSK
jgi:peroxiredoxin